MFFKALFKRERNNFEAKYTKVKRGEKILPIMLGHTFYMHTGRRLKKISIVRSHIGFKFGEFCYTRRLVKHKKKKQKKNK